ncbi:Cytochrome b [Noviherbaspirillum humi]|uniref:Cytochrome b n=1 Tax=Noviherbaspirillum humi TaxID=1688639 RepID=A0A239DGG9_9BURK|nr:cytochrome b/b6 domain-containing protein [Noviherbaspirillum humi]SNS30863.1 Cytochrome b [Noviherbaspirillum humi]
MVLVWDRLVRLIHWGVAALVAFNFLNEGGSTWHRYAGYATATLVLTRLAWGRFSRGHARFSRWWPGIAGLRAYFAASRAGRAPRFLGINPAGACMAVLLWLLILALGISGWMMGLDAFWGDEWLEILHEVIGYGLLACIGLHVASVIFVSIRHRENLPKAMLTGKKRPS